MWKELFQFHKGEELLGSSRLLSNWSGSDTILGSEDTAVNIRKEKGNN